VCWAAQKGHLRTKTALEQLNPEPISADNAGLSKTVNSHAKGRPTIALALGGGGIRGAAHIGVLRVLQKEGIPVDYIAGCSMGSIVGGLYSAGVPLDEIDRILMDKSLQNAFAPGWLTWAVFLYPTKRLIRKITFQDRPYAGLFTGKKFRNFLSKRLPADKQRLEDLNIPFVPVCTNLLDGKAYKLAKGDFADAVLASSAVPPIVRPVRINGNLYIDGGARSNVPVVSARQFGADLVIAVSVDGALKQESIKKYTSVRNVATRVSDIIMTIVDEHHLQKADLAIVPDVYDIPLFSKKTKFIKPAIEAGEKAAYEALPQIRAAIEKAKLEVSSR
jgi:NTE family protein